MTRRTWANSGHRPPHYPTVTKKEWVRELEVSARTEWDAENDATQQAGLVAGRGPIAVGYLRCSHRESADSGLGLAAQRKTVDAYYAFVQPTIPTLPKSILYLTDAARTAWMKHLFSRPAGAMLQRVLQSGDHLIAMCIDRIMRGTKDLLELLEWCKRKEVKIHFVHERVDSSTAMGGLMVTVMAAVAQHHSDNISERTKAALDIKRSSGIGSVTGPAPYGFVWVGPKGGRLLVPTIKPWRFILACVYYRNQGLWPKNIPDRLRELKKQDYENHLPQLSDIDEGLVRRALRSWAYLQEFAEFHGFPAPEIDANPKRLPLVLQQARLRPHTLLEGPTAFLHDMSEAERSEYLPGGNGQNHKKEEQC